MLSYRLTYAFDTQAILMEDRAVASKPGEVPKIGEAIRDALFHLENKYGVEKVQQLIGFSILVLEGEKDHGLQH